MTTATAHVPPPSRDNATEHDIEIALVGEGENPRPAIEHFIRTVFRHAYGARISHFLPHLLSMRQGGKVVAALGINPATDRRLFLERYLDNPVECILAEKLRRPIGRNQIVEIGNLASSHGGGTRALIITLTAYLSGAGYEWALFTATPRVRNNFAKLGIELIPLVRADKTRLGDAQHNWGSYYEQEPVVVTCDIRQGAKNLLKALATQQRFTTTQQLWDDALHTGQQSTRCA